MGRRYIYNKKKRVRKNKNCPNTIVLELENEKRLTLPSTLNHKNQSDDNDKLSKRWSDNNRLLLDFKQPMVLNVKQQCVVFESLNEESNNEPSNPEKLVDTEVLNENKAEKIEIEPLKINSSASISVKSEPGQSIDVKLQPSILKSRVEKRRIPTIHPKPVKSESEWSINTEITPQILNKNRVNKIRIEPVKKTTILPKPVKSESEWSINKKIIPQILNKNKVNKIRIEPLRKTAILPKPVKSESEWSINTGITSTIMNKNEVNKIRIEPLKKTIILPKPVKSESEWSINTGITPPIINKNGVNKMRIEPLKKNSTISSPPLETTIAHQLNNVIMKNNPTFILVSKTSMDDIEKKPINLNINLKKISFKSFQSKISNSQTKKTIVQLQKPKILPKSSISNPIVYTTQVSSKTSQVSKNIQYKSILRKSFSPSSNSVINLQNPVNQPRSYGCLTVLDKALQSSSNVQQESILQKLTSASVLNPIVYVNQSDTDLLCHEDSLVQDSDGSSIVQENTLDKNKLKVTVDEDNGGSVYPVALKATARDNGAPEIFGNDSCSEDEMQILGI